MRRLTSWYGGVYLKQPAWEGVCIHPHSVLWKTIHNCPKFFCATIA
jgi:hypothetical protein